MARWTEQDIVTFWRMRNSGATLAEIADALGRTQGSVEQKSHEFKKQEENKMIETNKIAPETTTEVNEAVPECAQAPDAEIPALDTAVDQALALIASQGLAFDIMHMTLSDGGATLELHFARRPS